MLESLTKDTLYEYPSFKVALFSILISFVLSSVIAFTYYLTNRNLAFSRNFFQAMILSAVVSCMVIMAVGNNVAAGFGIIGAIAIIRFRISIQNPRNIIFIFGALSVGIAAGVYGFSIAISGTLVFCLIAGLLYLSPFGAAVLNKEFNLLITIGEGVTEGMEHQFLSQHCQSFRLTSINSTRTGSRHNYFIILKKEISEHDFFKKCAEYESFSNIKLERNDNLDNI